MFNFASDGNVDDDVTLFYKASAGNVSFSLNPKDAHFFFGKDGDTEFNEVSASATMSLQIHNDLITVCVCGDKSSCLGSLNLTLYGADKVESLLDTLSKIREHLRAHA